MSSFVLLIQFLSDMKRFNLLLVFFTLVLACRGQERKQEPVNKNNGTTDYAVFGDEINDENAIADTEMAEKYCGMVIADTVRTKFKATVTDVCQAKGCWMKVQLQDGQVSMVRFKDYGFFMPKDIAGKEVIVNGFAFVEAMSVEDQKHYAKDGGRSEAEIAKITQPKKTYGFEADGVLLVKQ